MQSLIRQPRHRTYTMELRLQRYVFRQAAACNINNLVRSSA